jgi:chemotaxis protein MotB
MDHTMNGAAEARLAPLTNRATKAPRARLLLTAGWLLVAAPGCLVREELYDRAVADARRARRDASEREMQLAALQAQLQAQLGQLAVELRERDLRMSDATTAQAGLVRKLDELAVLNAELSERLRSAGHSVEQLHSERGSLSEALADTRAKLDELRRQQAAAEARAAQFRELAARFQKMVDAGQLHVALRDGRMLIELPNDVLFDSAKTELKPAGRAALRGIADVLRTMPERRFQVAGHTDDKKIQSARFPSNWELSAVRAVEVVKLLIESGMSPSSLSAAGFGEFAPVSPNDTPEGRGKNRRIEIALVPALEEMVKLQGAAEAPAARAPGAPGAAAR